jgi:hypothetical protein
MALTVFGKDFKLKTHSVLDLKKLPDISEIKEDTNVFGILPNKIVNIFIIASGFELISNMGTKVLSQLKTVIEGLKGNSENIDYAQTVFSILIQLIYARKYSELKPKNVTTLLKMVSYDADHSAEFLDGANGIFKYITDFTKIEKLLDFNKEHIMSEVKLATWMSYRTNVCSTPAIVLRVYGDIGEPFLTRFPADVKVATNYKNGDKSPSISDTCKAFCYTYLAVMATEVDMWHQGKLAYENTSKFKLIRWKQGLNRIKEIAADNSVLSTMTDSTAIYSHLLK